MCSSSDVHTNQPPQVVHISTTAPSLVRGASHPPSQYYSPLMSVGGYPCHQASDHVCQQLYLASVDTVGNHGLTDVHHQSYSALPAVNSQLLRYSLLPMASSSQMPRIVTADVRSDRVPEFDINCVHIASGCNQNGPVMRSKGVNVLGNSHQKAQNRHKTTQQLLYSRTSSHLPTLDLVDDNSNSSSESDQEKRTTQTLSSQSHLVHYASSYCDADVSENSTGMESDGPCMGSGGSQVNLSTRSVFGSSDVPSDVSSCDSNVYGMGDAHQDISREVTHPVLLKPACMKLTTSKHKAQPGSYSVIKGSNAMHSRLVRHGTPEAEDSDQTLSSVDTGGISPNISGWSSNSGSDSSMQNSTSQGPVAVVPGSNSSNFCSLCQRRSSRMDGAAFQTQPILPLTGRSEMFLPSPALHPELLRSRNSAIQVLHGRPPEIFHAFCHSSFDFIQNTSSHVYDAQVNMESSGQPYVKELCPPERQENCWNSLPASCPIPVHQDSCYIPKETLSKAGSTCSFYCYPSNQQSSSASSSPLHTHQPEDRLTHHSSNYQNNSHHGSRKSLVVHSNQLGMFDSGCHKIGINN